MNPPFSPFMFQCYDIFHLSFLSTEYLSTNFFAYTLAKLDGNDNQIISDMWPWECAMRCTSINAFTCRSFDYDRVNRVCYLSSTNKDLAGVGLTPTQDTSPFDYYERGRQFKTYALKINSSTAIKFVSNLLA